MAQPPESEPETKRGVVARAAALRRDPAPLDAAAPRHLQPKTARVIARRRAGEDVPPAGPQVKTIAPGAIELTAADGSVSFLIKGAGCGLSVQRTQRRPLGMHVVQTVVLENMDAFERWVAADVVRFEHPLIYERLMGAGRDFFRIEL